MEWQNQLMVAPTNQKFKIKGLKMEAEVVVMSTGMMMLVGTLLFMFRKGIFNMAELVENTLDEAIDTSNDALETYGKIVKVSNAKKREELLAEIREIETRVTSKQLQSLLDGKSEEEVFGKAK